MSEVRIRREGRTGRITLNRADALNALTRDMVVAIERALLDWAVDDAIALVLIDGAGDRAFCAGGDLSSIHAALVAGDGDAVRAFWRDEYRMNATVAAYPKPVVAFLHGLTLGGGVGLGCHASHRIVDDTSRIALPECGLGLVPDVGSSRLLRRAPGRMGMFLGITGRPMAAADAVWAGFADTYVPGGWDGLKDALSDGGDVAIIEGVPADGGTLAGLRAEVDELFLAASLGDLARFLVRADGPAARIVRTALDRNAPLAMACALAIQGRLNPDAGIVPSLDLEYRYVARIAGGRDFAEGIRARLIDRDDAPRWDHAGPDAVTEGEVSAMLRPLPPGEGWGAATEMGEWT
ncbi:enoyl-CoA hydratase/isomerase family protein [Jannaschia sp. LMIT008]|uniref:enoyl-CoA hydratase/isomerase family protein n=1 Tax=Jannaschia maritima TaxID=3032585 RepID=UPI002810ED73|nr:enoyl-CoA hydratase/isomerase family protein [Jannaschia sp. LMIT008]